MTYKELFDVTQVGHKTRAMELLAMTEVMSRNVHVWQPLLPGPGRPFVIEYQDRLRKVEIRFAPPDAHEKYDAIVVIDLVANTLHFYGLDGLMSRNYETNPDRVIALLKQNGPMKRAVLQQQVPLNARELDATLVLLGTKVIAEPTERGRTGRPGVSYRLAPDLVSESDPDLVSDDDDFVPTPPVGSGSGS